VLELINHFIIIYILYLKSTHNVGQIFWCPSMITATARHLVLVMVLFFVGSSSSLLSTIIYWPNSTNTLLLYFTDCFYWLQWHRRKRKRKNERKMKKKEREHRRMHAIL